MYWWEKIWGFEFRVFEIDINIGFYIFMINRFFFVFGYLLVDIKGLVILNINESN